MIIAVADFETTAYDNIEKTEVWAAAQVELYTKEVRIWTNINDFFEYNITNDDVTVYFHNLKFDGQFLMYYLLHRYEQAFVSGSIEVFRSQDDMEKNTFKYLISDSGEFYSIVVRTEKNYITFLDSYKILPFSVRVLSETFNCEYTKGEIDYKRHLKCDEEITDEEKGYIERDVLIVKEAIEMFFNEGHNKMTIGSCCLNEYINSIGQKVYNKMFPDLTKITLDPRFGSKDVDEYIRRSYRGGWCYLVKGKENQIKTNGLTLDVNSLYPSVMSGESLNRYPVGMPTFWVGEIPEEAKKRDKYYFVRLRTSFRLKKGMLPTIQIKNSFIYRGNSYLDESKKEGLEQIVTMTLTCVDYELIKKHYDLYNTTCLDGCYFNSKAGIFDSYINKYREQKEKSKGAKRTIAKLFLNNLYGKMASNRVSNYKVAYLFDDQVKYKVVKEEHKKAGYIPVGSAITSYARAFTITAAQQNYYGVNCPGFIYADTDSIHCDLNIKQIKGVKIDDTKFLCWKCENEWKTGLFVRQKTYIEIGDEYVIKCAGMPERSKQLFLHAVTGNTVFDSLNQIEQDFLSQKYDLKDFKQGLTVPGKLVPKVMPGGVVLKETSYTIK